MNYTSVQHLVDQHTKKKEPENTISLPKEAGPAYGSEISYDLPSSDAAEIEPQPEKEVSEYVEVKAEELKLSDDLKNAGLQAVQSSQLPPSFSNVKLPISDETVIQGLEQPITSSKRWYAEMAIYILGQAHIALRKVHGKVIRVIKRS